MKCTYTVDPVTRYVHISYPVPMSAPEEISVVCRVIRDGEAIIPGVLPYVSDTAYALMSKEEWSNGIQNGLITERQRAGQTANLVWNPFLRFKGNCKGVFQIDLMDQGHKIAGYSLDVDIDNSDVLLINDWNQVIQSDLVAEHPVSGQSKWWHRKQLDDQGVLFGDSLLEAYEKDMELPQLTYPLNLQGTYGIFISVPPKLGAVELRLTGDDRADIFNGSHPGKETFWRWTDMTRQHLVIKQPYRTVYEYEEDYRAYLDTVRLVPLDETTVKALEANRGTGKDKKIVAGYYEPYSWSFYDKIERNIQHLEPITAFSQAQLDILDIQYGRGGSKMSNETRVGDQLIKDTYGDPVRGKVPRTNNVGRMQQYTNMTGTSIKYAKMLGLKPFMSLGATSCYVGSSLESDFSKKYPEYRDGNCLSYEIPQVREYILSLFEEVLEMGGKGISIDWCRYPNSVKDSGTVTLFFRELRELANRYSAQEKVKICTRFPAKGVTASEYMDYKTWVQEELIDYLCPSNIQGRHLNFDIKEYADAVKGTKTKLLPCVDGLGWGLEWPGMFYQRIQKCYEGGADGIYIYQCDSPVLGSPEARRYLSITGYPDVIKTCMDEEKAKQVYYSKNIYITQPIHHGNFMPYERLRIWCEGFIPETVEVLLDGKLTNTFRQPPYLLTSEDRSDDKTVTPGVHIVTVRAKDDLGLLEKSFEVSFG
ncbi:MAG TPA: hypothetical protein DDZ89_22170 [Clostridiales bacterium]|nr:hypothetical protein [Clostridiales bacterium]